MQHLLSLQSHRKPLLRIDELTKTIGDADESTRRRLSWISSVAVSERRKPSREGNCCAHRPGVLPCKCRGSLRPPMVPGVRTVRARSSVQTNRRQCQVPARRLSLRRARTHAQALYHSLGPQERYSLRRRGKYPWAAVELRSTVALQRDHFAQFALRR
jgi:hypothetical protein